LEGGGKKKRKIKRKKKAFGGGGQGGGQTTIVRLQCEKSGTATVPYSSKKGEKKREGRRELPEGSDRKKSDGPAKTPSKKGVTEKEEGKRNW